MHPAALLEQAEAVYVVTSQMGFEALLWGRPVHCFGMPFYAGWGLTHDRLPAPERRRGVRPSLEALVHAALVRSPRCLDPHSLEPCPVETLMAAIGLQRRRQAEDWPRVEAFGFTPWKQPHLRRFLAGSRVRFRWARVGPVASWMRWRSGGAALSRGCWRRPVDASCRCCRWRTASCDRWALGLT